LQEFCNNLLHPQSEYVRRRCGIEGETAFPNMQKFLLWSLISAVLATTSVRAQSASSTPSTSAHFYVQPSAIVAFPGGEFDAAAGGAVALGVSFSRFHSIEVEGMYFQSSDGYGAKMKFSPVVATYKFTVPVNAKLSLYLGASVGVMQERLELPYYYYPYYGTTHLKDNAFMGGVTGGIKYELSRRISLDAGAKALQVARTDFTSKGNIPLLQAGLSFRF